MTVEFRDGTDRTVVPLRDFDFSAAPGELVCVVGPSGSGKTTLLRTCLGLVRPNGGSSVQIAGVDMLDAKGAARARRDDIGYVPQAYSLLPFLSISENLRVSEVLGGEQISDESIKAALGAVGIGHLMHRRPDDLSGGERQRCAIARALVKQATVLVADEPSGALDEDSTGGVMDAIEAVVSSGIAAIVATHDPTVIGRATRVVAVRQ